MDRQSRPNRRVGFCKSKRLFHPNTARLIAFQDGELRPRDMHQVAFHLKTCRKCELELDRLRADFQRFSDITALQDSEFCFRDGGCESLRNAIQQWKTAKSVPTAARAAYAVGPAYQVEGILPEEQTDSSRTDTFKVAGGGKVY